MENRIKRFDRVKGERGTWESHWEEIAERVIPRMSDTFYTGSNHQTKGDKRTTHMYDATAALGVERFAAVMESMLTPRNGKWHSLRASEDSLNKDRSVQEYFESVNNLLFKHRYAPKANFASQNHENFIGLGAFGTACMFTDELEGGGLRYRSIHLSEIYFLENHQGIIDTAFREFPLSARQIAQRWGMDRLPDKVLQAVENEPEKEFQILHTVTPREDMDTNRVDYMGMLYASYYDLKEGNIPLSEGGYNVFPYSISRYVTAPSEVYGRSPAMLALPAIKVLNQQKKTLLKQGHRAVDPVLLTHDDGVLDTLSLKAGAVNVGGVNADGRSLVQALPVGNPVFSFDMMELEKKTINDAFLVSLFQIMTENPQMTATEVLERTKEKGALLSPTMGRQQSEALGPLIERELDLLNTQGMLPEMPPALLEAEGDYRVEYESPLSRAQKAEEATGLFRAIEFAGNYANITGDVSVFDNINMDAAMPKVMEINGVPPSMTNSEETIASIREQRAQQAQQQQMIEAAPAAAGIMKQMGEGGGQG